MTTTTDVAPVTERAHVGWGDLAWLTWRQHRWTIVSLVVVAGAAVALVIGLAWQVDATGGRGEVFGRWSYVGVARMMMLAPMTIGLAIAVFWAAPLLSREYEQRTHLVVWSQDITATRWLTGKVVLLGVPAVALAVAIGLAVIELMDSINAVKTGLPPFSPFEMPAFEMVPVVQAGYAAFGFALGLALSAVTRRTVLSMALAFVSFIAVRILVTEGWRPYFQTPLRKVESYEAYERSWTGPRDGSWTVNSGFADAAGNEIPFPGACAGIEDNLDYLKCMADNNVHFMTEYHPADRLLTFQLFESAIFLALAAGLLALVFVRVRRAGRV
jgi:hypothetical protein